jgi:hypothetical protein
MMLLLKILWKKSFCWIFVSVPASNSLFNSASLYSLSGSSTVTLRRGRRKRSYLGKLPFCSNLVSISSFFFGASPSFDAVVFRAVNLAFDSILLSQAFLKIVWSLFGFSQFWLPSRSCWIFGALVDG